MSKEGYARVVRPEIKHYVTTTDGIMIDNILLYDEPAFVMISDLYTKAEALYRIGSIRPVTFRTKKGYIYKVDDRELTTDEISIISDCYHMGTATVKKLGVYAEDSAANDHYAEKFDRIFAESAVL